MKNLKKHSKNIIKLQEWFNVIYKTLHICNNYNKYIETKTFIKEEIKLIKEFKENEKVLEQIEFQLSYWMGEYKRLKEKGKKLKDSEFLLFNDGFLSFIEEMEKIIKDIEETMLNIDLNKMS